MRNKLVWCLLVGVATAMGATAAYAGDNWVGTWKLNPAKSELGTGAIRAQTLTFEATPGPLHRGVRAVDVRQLTALRPTIVVPEGRA